MADETATVGARVVAVIGMHRSGTSWLAGSLQACGLELGEVSEQNEHNLKGNRESPVLMDLHEGVLRDNDGSWKRPQHPNRWSPERRAQLADHIRAMHSSSLLWGFKDPRALLLLDEWHRQLPAQIEFVGIYRHPLAVHGSLSRRNPRFDEARSTKLWCAYNERLVEEHRRSPFTLLRFDVDPEELARGLDAVREELSLPAAEEQFFEQALVHNNAVSEQPVPRRCRKLWDYLEEHRLRV